MMNPRIERLPKFKEHPIPFFAQLDKNGAPDFKVINEEHRRRCALESLCWICGEKIKYWFVFIGGPQAVEHRIFIDAAMHEECARDAAQMCPFLRGDIDYAEKLRFDKHGPEVSIRSMPLASRKAPEKIALYKTRGFKVVGYMSAPKGTWAFEANAAYSIEWISRGNVNGEIERTNRCES